MRPSLASVTLFAIAALGVLTCRNALAAAPDESSADGPKSTASPDEPSESPHRSALKGILTDVKDYYTSPLRWDGTDWALLGARSAPLRCRIITIARFAHTLCKDRV